MIISVIIVGVVILQKAQYLHEVYFYHIQVSEHVVNAAPYAIYALMKIILFHVAFFLSNSTATMPILYL